MNGLENLPNTEECAAWPVNPLPAIDSGARGEMKSVAIQPGTTCIATFYSTVSECNIEYPTSLSLST